MEAPCPFFRNLHLRENLARDCFTSIASTVLPTVCKISLSVYVIVTNGRLQPLTATWYNSLVLSFSLLTIQWRWIKHRTFLRALRSWRTVVDRSALSFADGHVDCFTFVLARHLADVLRYVISEAIRDVKQTRRGCRTTRSSSNTLLPLIHDKARIEVYAIKCHTRTWKLN